MKKNHLLWLIAFALTLFLAIYQRLSGPTHPVRGRENIAGVQIKYRLLRSWTSQRPLPVRVSGDGIASMRLHYRRYPLIAGDEWSIARMVTYKGAFQAFIPGQPAAGKVAYKVEVVSPGRVTWIGQGKPVVARFKGEVPAWWLILHVVFMFAGLLLAFRAGLGALLDDKPWPRLVPWVFGITACGGLILGPIVQKFAFGAYWTGFPLGGDLTDSKTLFVILFWLGALLLRKKSRWWTVLATLLMVAVYMIPHSVLGSELDYKTGKVGTAKVIKD
jgi:hypothetical protein